MLQSNYLSDIESIIKDAKAGKMFILVDDEDRENEGDLVIPASMATAEKINFMATHGRGLICLALAKNRVEQLALPLMTHNNLSRHQTAFTISIEAKEGISTGISVHDRARTVEVAIDPHKSAGDLVSPGHIFPLMARDGGVLVRAGHTEAAVDIAKLAGLNPSGVICEIMSEDGSMARMPELIRFAQTHGLKIATIADLIAYRRKNDSLVEPVTQTTIHSQYGGEFSLIVYKNKINGGEHIALVKGKISASIPHLVRMHRLDICADIFGDSNDDKQNSLHRSMEAIAEEGAGVIVVIRDFQPDSLSQMINAKTSEREHCPKVAEQNLRDYGIGAQILVDLGIKEMTLLSNTAKSVIGLEGYGLEIKHNRTISPLAA